MVYVGTGRYLGVTDKSDLSTQAFYGVKDKWLKVLGSFTPITRTRLVEQTITREGAAGTTVDGTATGAVVKFPFRITSANEVDLTRYDGFYLTLTSPNASAPRGERVVAPAQVIGKKVIFNTLIPPVDSCEFGGTSWLMEVTALGLRFDTAILDTNGDGRVDSNDVAVNGHGFDELTTSPALIPGLPGGMGKIISGSSGNLQQVLNNDDNNLPRGRISWRQVE